MERLDRRTLIAFITIVVFLGVNFIAVKFSNQELQPFWGASLRFIIASVILYGIVALRKISLPRGAALKGALLFGLLGFTINFALLYWALTRASANMVSVTLATIPLITLFIASAVGLERITRRGIMSAVIVVAGIGLVFVEELKFDLPPVYLLAVLLAATSAAGSGIVVKYYPKSHPVATNAVGMSLAAALLFVLSLISGEARGLPTLTPTWLALGWLVLSSIVGFVLMVWLLSHWSASATSYVGVCTPLVTVASVLLITGEQPTLAFLIGSVIVLLGVYVGVISTAKAPAQRAGETQARDAPAD